MPAKIERRNNLEETVIKESTVTEQLFGVIADGCESEHQWVQLHQMFDR